MLRGLATYEELVLPLFISDVALRRRGTEFPKMPVRAQPFSDDAARPQVSRSKVAVYAGEAKLTPEDVEAVRRLIAGRPPRLWFRGHFLLDSIGLFVRARANEGKSKSVPVSNATLFAALADCSRHCEQCSGLMELLHERARTAVAQMTAA